MRTASRVGNAYSSRLGFARAFMAIKRACSRLQRVRSPMGTFSRRFFHKAGAHHPM